MWVQKCVRNFITNENNINKNKNENIENELMYLHPYVCMFASTHYYAQFLIKIHSTLYTFYVLKRRVIKYKNTLTYIQ